MKQWEKAIDYKWRAHASHTFLLYLNVADTVIGKQDKLETLAEHLVSSTPVGKAKFVAFFNRGSGIQFTTEQMEEEFLRFLAELYPAKNAAGENAAVALFHLKRKDPAYALSLFGDMLTISWDDGRKSQKRALAEKFAEDVRKNARAPFFAAVLEYVETIVPPDAACSSCQADRDALVTLEVWARSEQISDANNLIILVAESTSSVAKQLRSETSGITPLKLYFPDFEDRERVLTLLAKQYPTKSEMDLNTFANLTAGMSRRVITDLVKEACTKKRTITADMVFTLKKKFIEEQSGGLVEIIKNLWGIEAIGGLEMHKRYIRKVVKAMRENNPLAVPIGILLCGAYGVGKTVFAQAIAKEAGIPFVRLKNIREMWVGQSERNQEFALELIIALAPVVVFMDEIDQELQSRATMSDNTGVNNRLQGRLFQVIGDTDLRGRVLWIGATNQPNLLDPALLRPQRFGVHIPFFPPDAKERAEILPAILQKMKTQAAQQKKEFKWDIRPDFYEEFGWISHRHLDKEDGLVKCDPDVHPRGSKEQDNELAYTGGHIEELTQNAYGYADETNEVLGEKHLLRALDAYRPSRDFLQSERITDLAIMYATSEEFIPEGRWKKRARQLWAQRRTDADRTTLNM